MKIVQKIEQDLYNKILELMPILCVDIVIEYQGKALLVKRKNHPAKGQWWFPGGRVFKGETIEQAAVRNGAEEVGLECNFKNILGVEETYFEKAEDMIFAIHTINITVELDLIKYKEPAIDKDHSEFMWINRNSKEFHPSIQKILLKKGFRYGNE